LAQIILRCRELSIVEMKGNIHAQGEILAEEYKYTENFKKSSSLELADQFQSYLV
jgi:hypothetical protein